MCITVLAASEGCRCGATLELKADKVPLRGIHGRYESDGGSKFHYMIVSCPSCGAIYEPDHKRFAKYFNEARERLFRQP
jgi:hypothetical protein